MSKKNTITIRLNNDSFDWLKSVQEQNDGISLKEIIEDCIKLKRKEIPNVKIEDYEIEVHQLLVALNLVGISLDYLTADLIHKTIKRLNEKGKDMSLEDSAELQIEHRTKWKLYFEKLEFEKLSKQIGYSEENSKELNEKENEQ
jgi:hypothetical protein